MNKACLFHDPSDVYVGRWVTSHDIEISPELAEWYCQGTGDSLQSYGAFSVVGLPVAPALILHSEVHSDLCWYLTILFGSLHARQEWGLFAPICIGERVRTQVVVVERYHKRNRNYAVAEVLVMDEHGHWLQRSRTHQSLPTENPADGFAVDRESEKEPRKPWEVEPLGAALEGFERIISLPTCESFSAPVRTYHTDREMARAMGFPDVVVQGMMPICFVSELMSRSFGQGGGTGGS